MPTDETIIQTVRETYPAVRRITELDDISDFDDKSNREASSYIVLADADIIRRTNYKKKFSDVKEDIKNDTVNEIKRDFAGKFAEIDANIDYIKDEISRIDGIETEMSSIVGIRQDIVNINNRLDNFNSDINEIKSGITGIKEYIVDSLNEIGYSLNEFDTNISNLQTEISDIKEGVSGINVEISDIKQDISGINVEITDIKEGVSGINVDIVDMKDDISELQQNVGDIDLSSINNKIKELEDKINSLPDNPIIPEGPTGGGGGGQEQPKITYYFWIFSQTQYENFVSGNNITIETNKAISSKQNTCPFTTDTYNVYLLLINKFPGEDYINKPAYIILPTRYIKVNDYDPTTLYINNRPLTSNGFTFEIIDVIGTNYTINSDNVSYAIIEITDSLSTGLTLKI